MRMRERGGKIDMEARKDTIRRVFLILEVSEMM